MFTGVCKNNTHKMHTNTENYTQPKLSKAARGWYLHFRYDGKQYRFNENLNKLKDLKERAYEYEKLRRVILSRLVGGWNPSISFIIENKINYTIVESIDLGLEKKESILSKTTFQEYRATMKKIKICITKLNLDYLKITDCKKIHIKAILENAALTYDLTNNNYNKYITHFKAVLNALIDDDVITTNPVKGVKKRKHIKTLSHVPASFLDIERIKKELRENHYNFYVFAMTIYHTGIRPEELLKVRLCMVDMGRFEINLVGEITKNKTPRTTPIVAELFALFELMEFNKLPKDYFLFGSDKEKFKHGAQTVRQYIPAHAKIRRANASLLWRKVVKDSLCINMTLYALKKHGANAKILAGVSVGALKDLFGHSSELTTAIYITKLKEINRNEILEKSPKF
jgi:integrase